MHTFGLRLSSWPGGSNDTLEFMDSTKSNLPPIFADFAVCAADNVLQMGTATHSSNTRPRAVKVERSRRRLTLVDVEVKQRRIPDAGSQRETFVHLDSMYFVLCTNTLCSSRRLGFSPTTLTRRQQIFVMNLDSTLSVTSSCLVKQPSATTANIPRRNTWLGPVSQSIFLPSPCQPMETCSVPLACQNLVPHSPARCSPTECACTAGTRRGPLTLWSRAQGERRVKHHAHTTGARLTRISPRGRKKGSRQALTDQLTAAGVSDPPGAFGLPDPSLTLATQPRRSRPPPVFFSTRASLSLQDDQHFVAAQPRRSCGTGIGIS